MCGTRLQCQPHHFCTGCPCSPASQLFFFESLKLKRPRSGPHPKLTSDPVFRLFLSPETRSLSGLDRAMPPWCAMRFESHAPKSLAMRKCFFSLAMWKPLMLLWFHRKSATEGPAKKTLRCLQTRCKKSPYFSINIESDAMLACDSDSRCGLACDASVGDAKSLAMWVERCEPLSALHSTKWRGPLVNLLPQALLELYFPPPPFSRQMPIFAAVTGIQRPKRHPRTILSHIQKKKTPR